ncbi:MAG: TIGR02647 family protein [Sinobacterium sp.]|nr:TIGR02647 family protein [Sinobacterium sp.]
MPIPHDIIDEMTVLKQFNLEALDTGIKIHGSQAEESLVQAAERLYDKGLIDHKNGGYLTHRGIEAAQHVQRTLSLLQPQKETA